MPPFQRVQCMPAPCPCGFAPGWGQEWLQLSHLGWSCPTEVVRGGLSQTNGHRRVWGSHRASPAHLATCGSQCCTTGRSRYHPGTTNGVWALCTQRWRCCCWGHLPVPGGDPAGRRRLRGHLSVCNGCLFILTSSSSPPWAGG